MAGFALSAYVRSADLEITVQLLVQVDKLVQLIESPVFTCESIRCTLLDATHPVSLEDLRLQLLEPEKYPHLFKCLYGLLMLLPQSSAFLSLRNRLNAVNSAGFLHIAPKSYVLFCLVIYTDSGFAHRAVGNLSSTRSKLGREDIKWQELLQHFRTVQMKHEKARRQVLGTDVTSLTTFPYANGIDSTKPPTPPSGSGVGPVPPSRRKVTGDGPLRPPSRSGVLSPLNPKSRVQSGLGSAVVPPTSPTAAQMQSKVKRTSSLSRKT